MCNDVDEFLDVWMSVCVYWVCSDVVCVFWVCSDVVCVWVCSDVGVCFECVVYVVPMKEFHSST